MADVLVWLASEVIFGYLFYITGVYILKIVTFGKSKAETHSYRSYRDLKISKVQASSHAYLVGLLFYLVLLALLVLVNWDFT